MQPTVRPIPAADVRQLRHRVLRPFQQPDELVYAGDDHPLVLHAGAFKDDVLVGIATISPEDSPLVPGVGWRLRGMATVPEVRRQGYGAALIEACLQHMQAHGGTVLWCNGRTSALSFYQALGFQTVGEEFEISPVGPHYIMWRPVTLA